MLPVGVNEECDKIYVHFWHAIENVAWVMWCGQKPLVVVKVVVGLPRDVWFIVSMGNSCCTSEKKMGSMKIREPDWKTTWETLMKENPQDTSSVFL